jgi:5-methylcytosine-specific restriction endonuclease McrA
MSALRSLADAELIERLPGLVQIERRALSDVIEHLVEMERRRLYLSSSCSSLYRYCIDRLGYAEAAALNRHRVAQLALRLPQVLDELRAGTMHLTGLFLLSKYLTAHNAAALLREARGKSRREIEQLIARWFPRADVRGRLEPLFPEVYRVALAQPLRAATARTTVAPAPAATCLETGEPTRARLEPLSPSRLRVEFTARAELYEKVERARELLSHALPSGDLGELFERAVDALLEQESRKRFGAGTPRKARELKPGSRHVPVAIVRAVWQRDNAQCTFVGSEGCRCAERRFLTIEHRTPFAFGGPPTLENLCLLCAAHNLERARQVFGEPHIYASSRRRAPAARSPKMDLSLTANLPLEVGVKVTSALRSLGFGPNVASAAVRQVVGSEPGLDVEQLLRRCLEQLVLQAG